MSSGESRRRNAVSVLAVVETVLASFAGLYLFTHTAIKAPLTGSLILFRSPEPGHRYNNPARIDAEPGQNENGLLVWRKIKGRRKREQWLAVMSGPGRMTSIRKLIMWTAIDPAENPVCDGYPWQYQRHFNACPGPVYPWRIILFPPPSHPPAMGPAHAVYLYLRQSLLFACARLTIPPVLPEFSIIQPYFPPRPAAS
jgi:hypothetical protein